MPVFIDFFDRGNPRLERLVLHSLGEGGSENWSRIERSAICVILEIYKLSLLKKSINR